MTNSQWKGRTPVAVVRTSPETYGEDLRRALQLVRARRPRSAAQRNSPTLISIPAFTSLAPGNVLAPWTLAALIEIVEETTGRAPSLVLGALEAPSKGLDGTGLDRVLAKAGLVFETPVPDTAVEPSRVALPWLRGRRGGEVRVDGRLAGSDAYIAVPLRRHRQLGLRGAVDAALAPVATAGERAARPLDTEAWTELLRLRSQLHAATTFVLDATVCGSDDERDRPVVFDVLIVSSDPVLCDVVGAHLLGFAPERLLWLRRVAETTHTTLALDGVDLRGESFDRRAFDREASVRSWAGSRGAPWYAAGSGSVSNASGSPVRSLGWTFGWALRWFWARRHRRWYTLYWRSPWGRLHRDYRERGEARRSTYAPERRQETG